MPTVSVIDLRSLSYTGTTWINLLVGSHPQVFTMGPPQRAFRALDGTIEPDDLCRVHRGSCLFWPAALSAMAGDCSNLYSRVATLSAATHVAVNNPFVDPRGVKQLHGSDIEVVQLSVVRDVRSLVVSHRARHGTSVGESAEWIAAHQALAGEKAALRLRHEDVVADPAEALVAIGRHVGLAYPANAAAFWEHDHHLVGGNSGPLRELRSKTPTHAAPATADWAAFLTQDEVAQIQSIAGSVHEAWGYSW